MVLTSVNHNRTQQVTLLTTSSGIRSSYAAVSGVTEFVFHRRGTGTWIDSLLQATSTISSADIRRDLYWLPINHRISYKLSLLTWKALYAAEPSYLSELISPYVTARTSSNTYLLSIPTAVTSHFCSRSFSVSSPSTWNSLPQHNY